MHLTPDILRAAYDYLSDTPPFHKWNMPASEDIVFQVSRSKANAGMCVLGTPVQIILSCHHHQHSVSILMTMAHEMVHLHMHLTKMDRGVSDHGAAFRKLAERVCKEHGFDAAAF